MWGRRVSLAAGAAAVASLVLVAGPAGGAQAGGLKAVQLPGSAPNFGYADLLSGVSADSATDAWAVGSYQPSRTAPGQPLALRWNGTSWAKVPSRSGSGQFNGVSADTPADAWAVGVGSQGTLIAHWDGTSWAPVPSPDPGDNSNELDAVSAASPTDAWAVGSYGNATGGVHPLLVRWDGTSWAQVPGPSPALSGSLLGVSLVSPTNAWAVGNFSTGVFLRTLILHWDGTRWTKVPSPSPGKNNDSLSSVDALSATDAWAAGYRDNAAGVEKGLLLHWDGSSWTKVTCPNPMTRDTILAGVSIHSATDAWAAGYYQHIPPHRGPFHTLILHWNGTTWAQVPSPTPPTKAGGILAGVSAISASNAWAAGSYFSTSSPSLNLLLHWDGRAWTRL